MLSPFKHQQETFERASSRSYYAMFNEQGTGKTKIAIDLVEHHFANGRITACVVLAPKGILGNWSEIELPKHSTCEWGAYVWNGKGNANGSGGLQWFIVNVDGILSKEFPKVFKGFLKTHPSFALICDESTAFKNGSAARTKRAISIARLAKYRYIMSGTPVTNSPLDLYSQCEILSPEALGFQNKFAFRARYAKLVTMNLGTKSFQKIVGYKNLEELSQTLKEFSSIVKKEDCLDLPAKVYRVVPVPLSAEQEFHYQELKAKALTYIKGEEITVVNVISLVNKLLQICAGQIKLPDGTYLSLATNRLDTLSDLIRECSGKTIIWISFVGSAKSIEATLGSDCLLLPSGLTLEQRQTILERFRNDPLIKALVANPASSGHGITLVESSNTIYYSNSWNYEHRAQSEDRNHRLGQTRSVLYTDLVAPGTVEEKVIGILKNKKTLADSLITSREFVRDLLT